MIPDNAVWADESWSNFEREKMPEGKTCLVATTSWQQTRCEYLNPKHSHIIRPYIEVGETNAQKVPRSIVWAGDPADGSLTFLTAVVSGIRRRGGVPAFSVKAFPTTEPGIVSDSGVDISIKVGATDADIDRALSTATVYAAPSIKPTSFDVWAARAACHGALIVAPKAFGYPEVFDRLGAFLCIRANDPAEYGISFAATLVESLDGYTPDISSECAFAACSAFSKPKEEFAWQELRGFLQAANKE